MISHKHKCIFIHIAKCAGTSIEHAFGVDTNNHNADENDFLFGWDGKIQLWLQHATPQQLIDKKLISLEQWNSYYKFIVYRNSWSRAYSDYLWMLNVREVKDSFRNFLNKKGKYSEILTDKTKKSYAGDHLYLQKDYFYLNGKRINYDREINFQFLKESLSLVVDDLSLQTSFFSERLNTSAANKKKHYSYFYNNKTKELVDKIYWEDIDFFGFEFDERKTSYQKVLAKFK